MIRVAKHVMSVAMTACSYPHAAACMHGRQGQYPASATLTATPLTLPPLYTCHRQSRHAVPRS